MRGHGWDEATIARVEDLVHKRGLGKVSDADVQALEDALCLVFIETQYDELAAKLDDDQDGRCREEDPEKM